MKAMRLRALPALVVALIATGAAPFAAHQVSARQEVPPSEPPDTFVAEWDAVGTQAFSAAGLSPAEGYPIFAYVAVAVYVSVVAIKGGFEPVAVADDASPTASAEAAVAAAAHRTLVHYLPAQQATILDPAYTASLARIPDGPAEDEGVAVGERVAQQWITQRAGDGFRAPAAPYVAPNPPIPGVWIPTAASTPVGRYTPAMTPFTLASADQFRPAAPPALGSQQWARAYNEVKADGSATSTTRTAEQTVAARFWAEAPVQQGRAALRRFIADHSLGVVDAARVMAMTSVAYADAFIACFDAKYEYTFWRPITSVRAGDTDPRADTIGDPTWTPLLPGTPNHPEYPSAHSCLTPAAGLAIAAFLGSNRIDFTVPSLTGLGDRTFKTVRDLEKEVGNARIWGGIHYRFSTDAGIAIGRKVAHNVVDAHFQPVT
jgi:hypothetical protein